MDRTKAPILYLIVPCYNEEALLPITSRELEKKRRQLIREERISPASRILFVDDGSKDHTWEIICGLAEESQAFLGIAQSRNRGHQNAVLAGLMEAKDCCDITITMDCDGQDDIQAVDEMVAAYENGYEVVYGVRRARDKDTWFKRTTAEGFYHLMRWMGTEVVFNHGDYRLLSSRVLQELARFPEVNLFLRGMVPLIGFPSTSVYYERQERIAGESHYPLKKMLALAFDGITSLSTRPLHLITMLGLGVALLSFAGVAWSIVMHFAGRTVDGWASMTCILCFVSGIQLISLGMIGEYIGKIYKEVKRRPTYIISGRTGENREEKEAAKGKGEM